MTKEGRLMRGKANLESKKNLTNPETLEYIESMSPPKPTVITKPKLTETKTNAKFTK